MNFRSEEILSQELVGWHAGAPVYAIETKGGYNVIAALRNGKLDPLARAPHRAMARAIAKRQQPDVRWTQLEKSADTLDPTSPLFRAYEAQSIALRRACGF